MEREFQACATLSHRRRPTSSMINSFTRISNPEKTSAECATFARVKSNRPPTLCFAFAFDVPGRRSRKKNKNRKNFIAARLGK